MPFRGRQRLQAAGEHRKRLCLIEGEEKYTTFIDHVNV